MTTQVSVRLPDELVEFVDGLVKRGTATSRAAVITRLLAREQRRQRALLDLDIIRRAPDHDLDGLAKWQAHHSPPIDD
jgi:Arc/MetJ-type ribon-helix-helix transcriptional regulator